MLGQTIAEGALRAAQLVPLLFALNAPSPEAMAQLPRPAPAEPPFADAAEEPSPLVLAAHHVDVAIRGGQARVRSRLTYRNEGTEPVAASFAFRYPALLRQGESWRALGEESTAAADGDDSAQDAEFLEAGEPVPPRIDVGYVTVAPGEEVELETHRTVALEPHGRGWRLALPLPSDRGAPYAPQFSAGVTVEESPAVARLASSTHDGTATGLGTPRAQFEVPAGRAYLAAQFVLEVDVGRAGGVALWGGEARPR